MGEQQLTDYNWLLSVDEREGDNLLFYTRF